MFGGQVLSFVLGRSRLLMKLHLVNETYTRSRYLSNRTKELWWITSWLWSDPGLEPKVRMIHHSSGVICDNTQPYRFHCFCDRATATVLVRSTRISFLLSVKHFKAHLAVFDVHFRLNTVFVTAVNHICLGLLSHSSSKSDQKAAHCYHK